MRFYFINFVHWFYIISCSKSMGNCAEWNKNSPGFDCSAKQNLYASSRILFKQIYIYTYTYTVEFNA